MDYQIAIGVIALVIGVYGYVPYFWGMWRGRVKPHVFTWFIWGLITAIGYGAQLYTGGGAGTWVVGFTAFMCLVIAVIGLRIGHRDITRSDWVFFWMAILAIPLWLVTHNPVYSVILITVIDVLGFLPTIRKSWMLPWDEAMPTYVLSGVKFSLSLFALEQFNFISAFYVGATVVLNFAFVGILLVRRYQLRHR